MKSISLFLLAVSLLGVSCERHDFAETRKLQDEHGAPHAEHETHDAHQ